MGQLVILAKMDFQDTLEKPDLKEMQDTMDYQVLLEKMDTPEHRAKFLDREGLKEILDTMELQEKMGSPGL